MDNPPVIDEDTSVSHLSGLNRSCDCWDECGHEVQNLCEVCDYETSSTADYWDDRNHCETCGKETRGEGKYWEP